VYATPLPSLLRYVGYRTIHCGKAHFGAQDTPGEDPLNLGFDVNIAGHAAGSPGSYSGLTNFGNRGDGPTRPWGTPGLQKYHGKEISLTEALTLEAITAVKEATAAGKPFFLYMSHYTVHTPLQNDPRFAERYEKAGLHPKEVAYASMVEGMDKSLGDLMTMVRDNGFEENTVILFLSDNGGLSAVGRGGEPHTHNRPLASGKGSAREGGIRVPTIVKAPGIGKANSSSHTPIIIEDYFPTILELAGVESPSVVQEVDGVSFLPLIEKPGLPSADRPLFWHYPNNWGPTGPGIGASSTVRKGPWKLIYYHADQRFELFNLERDLGEESDRSRSEPKKLRELAGVLDKHLRGVGAQMPKLKSTGELVPYPGDAVEGYLGDH
jgi:arylsulfatase A-like enzyme